MRVLVVEDDLTLSAGVCFELDCNGYLTVAAYNCKKAAQLIQNDHFDLAILDVNLPDGNGFDLCHVIKDTHPEIPVTGRFYGIPVHKEAGSCCCKYSAD